MEGARIFFQSLDAEVLLFSRVTNILTESLVLPDGTIVHGKIASVGSFRPVDKKGSSVPALASSVLIFG
ncbi:hypothetical protein MKW98_002242 [Papaver atlanticum]|uniref:Uncharacterized protein n=1 Tax=Papaver atlanticum TaxID=357466 RepID=A0AAD4X3W8_9MAGN|nr:hypothetical protein MKW98_002242 [Papaver atlanticum]